MKLTYHYHGDYLLPDLGLTEEERQPLGKYGQMRLDYLQTHRPTLYTQLLLAGQLVEHLPEIERTCQEWLALLIPQMKPAEGVTETLKLTDQLEWVRRMNSIIDRWYSIGSRQQIHILIVCLLPCVVRVFRPMGAGVFKQIRHHLHAQQVNQDGEKTVYHINRRPSQLRKYTGETLAALQQEEHEKSSIRVKVEHVFCVVKRIFRFCKTRYRGREKLHQHSCTLFALANA